jgi:Predicted acetyltransferase
MPTIRVVYENVFPGALDEAVRRNLCIYHPDGAETFRHSRSWHGSFPLFSIVAEKDGDAVGYAGLVERTILVGGSPYRIVGVQNVYVATLERGTGLSDKIMTLAMEEAAKAEFDFGLLFCIPKLEPIYGRTGWIRVDNAPVIRREEGGEFPLPGVNIAMFYPLLTTCMPDGPIDLNGNDW